MSCCHHRGKTIAFSAVTLTIIGLSGLSSSPVAAEPAAKVYSPMVEAGETELEFRGGYVEDDGHPEDGEQQYVVAVGHGLTSRWFTELVLEYEGGGGESQTLQAVEWENIFQLTERGQYFVDLGLYTAYVVERESGKPDQVEIGPLLQYQAGAAQLNFNPLFEREVGDGSADETRLNYAAQIKWRGNRYFEPGVQAFGELGEWDNWAGGSEQKHNLGPAFFGRIKTHLCTVKYEAAWLVGLTRATPDNTFRFELEIEY
jgi:hypothetical protein